MRDDPSALAQTDVLVPLAPRLHVKVTLERHEEGVVGQPVRVFCFKRRDSLAVARKAARLSRFEQRKTVFIEPAVVDAAGVCAPVAPVHFLARQKTVLHEQVKVNEVGVARKGGKALIR